MVDLLRYKKPNNNIYYFILIKTLALKHYITKKMPVRI